MPRERDYAGCKRRYAYTGVLGRAGTRNKTIKTEKIMATLRDLCKDVPVAIDAKALEYAINRRKNAAYLERMGALRAEENVFGNCQQRRPNKGKAKNRYSREEAGTCGSVTMGIRTGAYSVCVCKTTNKY